MINKENLHVYNLKGDLQNGGPEASASLTSP